MIELVTVVPISKEDVGKLSVKELKLLARISAADLEGCLEKGEIVDAIYLQSSLSLFPDISVSRAAPSDRLIWYNKSTGNGCVPMKAGKKEKEKEVEGDTQGDGASFYQSGSPCLSRSQRSQQVQESQEGREEEQRSGSEDVAAVMMRKGWSLSRMVALMRDQLIAAGHYLSDSDHLVSTGRMEKEGRREGGNEGRREEGRKVGRRDGWKEGTEGGEEMSDD
jgi:hypothetical protein